MKLKGDWFEYKQTPCYESKILNVRFHIGGFYKKLPHGQIEQIFSKDYQKQMKLQGYNKKRALMLYLEQNLKYL